MDSQNKENYISTKLILLPKLAASVLQPFCQTLSHQFSPFTMTCVSPKAICTHSLFQWPFVASCNGG